MSNVRTAAPYTPGEQPKTPGIIKLNTNENPFPPSPAVIKTLREFEGGGLRLYPDPESSGLKSAIAKRYGLEEKNVFVGVGSDDVLAMSFLLFSTEACPSFSRT